jgi:hypothetical protein
MKSYSYLLVSCLDFASVSFSGALDADDTYILVLRPNKSFNPISTTWVQRPLASDDETEFVALSDTTVPPASTFVFPLHFNFFLLICRRTTELTI